MENRILIIGDELFGQDGEGALRLSEMILCETSNRPLQFSINAPIRLTISQLIERASADIIGKKAGRIVLGLGLYDLKREDDKVVALNYKNLVKELLNKTQSYIDLVTIPVDMFQESPSTIENFNQVVKNLVSLNNLRLSVFDWAMCVEDFQKKQVEKGKFGRSLFSDSEKPSSLCITLLSIFLKDCILKEIMK